MLSAYRYKLITHSHTTPHSAGHTFTYSTPAQLCTAVPPVRVMYYYVRRYHGTVLCALRHQLDARTGGIKYKYYLTSDAAAHATLHSIPLLMTASPVTTMYKLGLEQQREQGHTMV